MIVRQLQVAEDGKGEYMNHITVESKTGAVFHIDLIRPYNMIKSGATAQDIQELVTTVYDLTHRDLQAEKAVNRINDQVEQFLHGDEGYQER